LCRESLSRQKLPRSCRLVLALFERPNVRSGLALRLWSLTNIADGKFWEFTSDMTKGDTAYTSLALAAHTDNTYFVRLLAAIMIRRLILK
jgi:hypothetical protein